jgi:hypothetical protein
LNIIGITGPAGSGKSTAASYLVKQHGFVHLKFAGALKEMLRTLLEMVEDPYIERRIEGDLKETPCFLLGGNSPRHAMQTLGTEWGRNSIGADFWVEICERRAELALGRGERVVIDDVRFDNEAAMIRSLGGKVLRLNGRGGIAGTHVSEAGVAADLWFDNSGDIQQIHNYLATHIVAG